MAIAEIKKLEHLITRAKKRIEEIRKGCSHSRILHIEKPDIYCGWGVSDKCLRCGRMITIASIPFITGKPVRKIINRQESANAQDEK
mgnify:CR=1 FL=1